MAVRSCPGACAVSGELVSGAAGKSAGGGAVTLASAAGARAAYEYKIVYKDVDHRIGRLARLVKAPAPARIDAACSGQGPLTLQHKAS
jgi:hypothetical protein